MSKSSYSPERSQPIEVGDPTTNLPRTLCTHWLHSVFLAVQLFSRGIQFILSSWIVRHVIEEDYAVTTDRRCNCIWSSYLFFSTRYEITFVVSRSVKADFFFCGFSHTLYAVKFHLFVSCILFVSREGLWGACLRADIRWYIQMLNCWFLPIGRIIMAFGLSYSYSLIRILYGQKWSDGKASTALKYYTLYIVILAGNGTSEAFLHAVATENSLGCWNDSLLVFSLIYLVLNVCLIRSIGAVDTCKFFERRCNISQGADISQDQASRLQWMFLGFENLFSIVELAAYIDC